MSLFSKLNEGSGKETPRPRTRLGQFFYIIKNDFFTITMISLLTILFVLPLVIFTFLFVISLLKIKNEEDISQLFSFGVTNCLLIIPFILVASLGICGGLSLFKKMAFGEVYRLSDFFVGIKDNWHHFLLIGLVKGISIAIFIFSWLFYDYYTTANLALVRIMASLQYLLISIVLMFVSSQTVTYKLGIWNKIKNSVIFTIYQFPINLGCFLLRAIPLFLFIIAQSELLLLLGFIFVFLGGTIYDLINIERSLYVFDKLVHHDELSQYYRKGLREE